ncbi:dnaJ protein, putative [Babesia caballi]|uniref:DnaJ protein, putative n=1 Tax=Babesia caballi TaxID=5871 RepID=A0AAV4LVU3_BABCB|nr:dnaJ protein, putative [Babesia caballi]
MRNYYAILDIARSATRNEIRAAYLRKAKLYHPDLNPSPNAAARFKEVQEAYNTLYDRDKRQAYDASHAFGSASAASSKRGQHHGGSAGRGHGYNPNHDSANSFEDHFRAEAEQLRRQWQEMQTDKLRRGAEKYKAAYSDGGFPGGVRCGSSSTCCAKSRRSSFCRSRFSSFSPAKSCTWRCSHAEVRRTNVARKNAKIHIVYDSYGRAYTYDAHGRRCR